VKITKRQLRRIIKEAWPRDAVGKLLPRQLSDNSDGPDLYVNLTDDQLEALDDLTACMERCRRLGIPEADIADTIRAGGF